MQLANLITQLTNLTNALTGQQTRSVNTKLQRPEDFGGEHAKYVTWKSDISIYVAGADKDRAISTIVSGCRGNASIDGWRLAFQKAHWTNAWSFADLPVFWAEMDATFTDPNKAVTAQQTLKHYRMRGKEAQMFFQEFKDLVSKAGYSKLMIQVINLLKHAVDSKIIGMIYATGNPPSATAYDDWKSHITTIDTHNHQWAAELGAYHHQQPRATHGHTAYAPPPHATPHVPFHPPAQPQVPTRRDATSVTFGGREQLMDLDHLCKKCGSRKRDKGTCGDCWHVPNRPQAIRVWEQGDNGLDFFTQQLRQFWVENPEELTEILAIPLVDDRDVEEDFYAGSE
ncbi:hypothetical protein V8D89_008186 [Ganoderma adspersum]